MNCWLHRISHFAQISNPLLEAGFLSIGFRAFSSERFIDTAIAGKVDEFNDTFKRVWAGLPRSRWALWNFLNKMKKGDMVVVPGWGTFSVYRIVGEKPLPLNAIKADLPKQDWMGNDIVWEDSEIEEADDIDIGFVWKVELAAKNVSRDLFATPALASKLKAGAINACITDLKDDVEKSLKAFGAGKPMNMRAALIDNATAEWKARIHEGLDCEVHETRGVVSKEDWRGFCVHPANRTELRCRCCRTFRQYENLRECACEVLQRHHASLGTQRNHGFCANPG